MRVLMVSFSGVGGAMASPGVRCWELAQALSLRHEVTLVAPLSRPEELPASDVRLVQQQWGATRKLAAASDVVVCQLITPSIRRAVRASEARCVLDAYVPFFVEGLDWHMGGRRRLRDAHLNYVSAIQNLGLMCADAVICASDRQRDLWFGSFAALGAIDTATYDADPSLAGLVTVVPIGCPDTDPVRSGPGPRELYDFADEDVVILWGGGVWNWFDPITVLEAVRRLAGEGLPVRLVFMGLTHPDRGVPEMEMTRQLYAAAADGDLLGTHVFLNEGWIDYDQRQAWLLDADIGVSAHGSRVEAKYAFRTRILDYLWAGLPVVATEGDALADVIAEERLGATVAAGDVDGWVDALRPLVADRALRRRVGRRVLDVRERYRWRVVVTGLEDAIAVATARVTRPVAERRHLAQRVHCATAAARLGRAWGIRITLRHIRINYVAALRARLAAPLRRGVTR